MVLQILHLSFIPTLNYTVYWPRAKNLLRFIGILIFEKLFRKGMLLYSIPEFLKCIFLHIPRFRNRSRKIVCVLSLIFG